MGTIKKIEELLICWIVELTELSMWCVCDISKLEIGRACALLIQNQLELKWRESATAKYVAFVVRRAVDARQHDDDNDGKRRRAKKTDNKRLFLKLDSSFIVLYQTDRLIRLDNVNSSINDMMKAYVVLNELVTISTGRSILLHTDHFVEKKPHWNRRWKRLATENFGFSFTSLCAWHFNFMTFSWEFDHLSYHFSFQSTEIETLRRNRSSRISITNQITNQIAQNAIAFPHHSVSSNWTHLLYCTIQP